MKEKSIRDILFFFEAWLFLNIAKLMILFFPFKKIAGKIGVPQFETEHENQTNETVVEVQIAVRRGVKFVFFSSKCYDQALASTFMLKRRNIPSTIYFGLNKLILNYLLMHGSGAIGLLFQVKRDMKSTLLWLGLVQNPNNCF